MDISSGSVITAVLTIITLILLKKIWSNRQMEKRYRQMFDKVNCTGISKEPPLSDEQQRKLLRQAFDPSLADTHWDVVIVGSGLSGLTTAKLLALAGRKVLVLEQHSKVGGACHTFKLHGVRFDVGVHYVSQMHPGTEAYDICTVVSDSQVRWSEIMDPVDSVRIGEKFYFRRRGGDYESFKRQLCQMFPAEEQSINAYFQYLEECLQGIDWLFFAKLAPLWVVRLAIKTGLTKKLSKVFDHMKRTLLEVMNEFNFSPELQTIVSYYWMNYASPPKYCSFLQHSLFFLSEGYYPVGGANAMTSSIVHSIEKLGSKVVVRADVKEICFKYGRAIGVKVESENHLTFVPSDLIVSTVPLTNLFDNLIPPEISSTSVIYKAVKQLNELERFKMGVFQVYICFDNQKNLTNYMTKNYYWLRSTDLNDVEHFLSLPFDKVMDEYRYPPFMYLSSPSGKDPLWAKTNPGVCACQIISFVNPSWFEFESTVGASKKEIRNERKQDILYNERKRKYGEYLLKCAKDHYDFELPIKFYEFSTPATQQYYLQNRYGEFYSLSHQAERFSEEIWPKLRWKSDIPGLYLSGQDVLFCGVTSAFTNGVITASVILGTNLRKILRDAVLRQQADAWEKKKK